MRCPNCGNENPPDYMFCDECGARLSGADTAANADTVGGPMHEAENASSNGQSDSEAAVPAMPAGAMAEAHGTTDSADTRQSGGLMSDTSGGLSSGGPSYPTEDAALDVPATEDTISAPTPDSMEATSGAPQAEAADTEQADMPDVVPIAPEGESGAAPVMESYSDTGEAVGAPTPTATEETPVSVGGPGVEWGRNALNQFDQAQQAMSRGDWTGFGQAMGSLRSLLESAAQGATSEATRAAMPAEQPSPAPYMGTASSPAQAASVGEAAPSAEEAASYTGAGSITAVEPAGFPQAGTLGAEEMPGVAPPPGTSMARLVVIATGAELPLPEQEEITVGREDPSSGIFPDVDLTPYGGEDGGVSRRHARLLHIGSDYFVEDLQSTNYTKLDGQRLPAHVRERLEDGARLDFGRVAMIFRRG